MTTAKVEKEEKKILQHLFIFESTFILKCACDFLHVLCLSLCLCLFKTFNLLFLHYNRLECHFDSHWNSVCANTYLKCDNKLKERDKFFALFLTHLLSLALLLFSFTFPHTQSVKGKVLNSVSVHRSMNY